MMTGKVILIRLTKYFSAVQARGVWPETVWCKGSAKVDWSVWMASGAGSCYVKRSREYADIAIKGREGWAERCPCKLWQRFQFLMVKKILWQRLKGTAKCDVSSKRSRDSKETMWSRFLSERLEQLLSEMFSTVKWAFKNILFDFERYWMLMSQTLPAHR